MNMWCSLQVNLGPHTRPCENTSSARLAVTHWRRRDSGSDGSWLEQIRNSSDASEYAKLLADKFPASAHCSPCSSRL